MSSQTDKTKVFISYNHRDTKHLKRLLIHLTDLEHKGLIEAWSDTKLAPGSNWREEIKKAIKRSGIAILLVSADFLASRFITENELPPLLTSAEKEGTLILPVIISPCSFEYSEISHLQSINSPSKPLSSLSAHQKEELWRKVSIQIRSAITTSTVKGSQVTVNNEIEASDVSVHISYGPSPENATIVTNNQFAILKVRYGSAHPDLIDLAKEVLKAVDDFSGMLGAQEYLMFRGMFFDDKNTNLTIYLDYLYDEDKRPSMTREEIAGTFWMLYHQDDEAPYTDINLHMKEASTGSDWFSPTMREYYDNLFFRRD